MQQTRPGAPNLSLPITPTLTLASATSEEISIAWNDPVEFGLDFIEFEIFRLESAGATVDLIDVYNTTRDNQSIDSNVSVGSTYWYLVRSVHTFGIASNLSNMLQVTVPYPSPPATITGLELMMSEQTKAEFWNYLGIIHKTILPIMKCILKPRNSAVSLA